MGNGRRVLYHPSAVKRFTDAILRHAREIQMLRDDIRHERDAIREERRLMREELRQAWAELRRLQALDAAQRAERDLAAPLQ